MRPREAIARSVLVLAVVKLAVQLVFAEGYGYFRDELYYLACARRLAFGYVDHPPFAVALLALERAALGDSRIALRFLPAVAGAVLVWLTGWLARELGGRKVAQTLAALAVLVAPEYLALDHFYSMNAFDLLFWTIAVSILARLFADDGARTRGAWVALGVALGLGLLNKLSVLWLCGGVGLGLLLTPQRRLLKTRGPYIAFAIAALLFAPHVGWQIANGWPTREFMKHATEDKMAGSSALQFLWGQVTSMQPLTALLWVPGLAALLFTKRLARFRPFGIAYLAILSLLLLNQKSRTGYLAPIYPVLFAAGGVVVEGLRERSTAAFGAKRAWLRAWPVALGVLLAFGGVVTLPLALPSLPVKTYGPMPPRSARHPPPRRRKRWALCRSSTPTCSAGKR